MERFAAKQIINQRFGADTRQETFFCFFSGMNAESILKIIFEKGEKNNERKN